MLVEPIDDTRLLLPELDPGALDRRDGADVVTEPGTVDYEIDGHV